MMRWTFAALGLFLGSLAIGIAQGQTSDETAAAPAKPRVYALTAAIGEQLTMRCALKRDVASMPPIRALALASLKP